MIDRIKQVMEYYKLSPASFAEQMGINRSNLTHLFSGRNQPSLEFAKKILHCFPDIKTEWLIMGVGQMFRSNDERELNIQLQKEKLMHISHSEPDLFSTSTKENVQETKDSFQEKKAYIHIDEDIPKKATEHKPLEKEQPPSHSTASINKIIFFYSDNSFEIFHQMS